MTVVLSYVYCVRSTDMQTDHKQGSIDSVHPLIRATHFNKKWPASLEDRASIVLGNCQNGCSACSFHGGHIDQ